MATDRGKARDVEAYVSSAAEAMDWYAAAARDAGLSDVALTAQDAADALFHLLDVVVARSRGVVPLPAFKA